MINRAGDRDLAICQGHGDARGGLEGRDGHPRGLGDDHDDGSTASRSRCGDLAFEFADGGSWLFYGYDPAPGRGGDDLARDIGAG